MKAADPNVLYRVEVLERYNEWVKVHWIGDSDDKDEWIPANSLTTLDSNQECKSGGVLHLEHYFSSISMKSWHIELRLYWLLEQEMMWM